jgi:hypothetical protein
VESTSADGGMAALVSTTTYEIVEGDDDGIQSDEDDLQSEDDKNQVIENERTFTLFPKLPAELRVKIWKFSTPEVRYIQPYPFEYNYAFHPEDSTILGANPPSSFSVCRESRQEVLPLYKPFQLVPGPNSPTFYMNPEMDVLCLTYLHGKASEEVWQCFAAQGIFFRQVAVWDSTGFFDAAVEKKLAGIRTEKPVRTSIDGMEGLLVVPKRWTWRNLITGFEDLNEEEFDD